VLTLQKCRSLLGADCNLTDKELEQLRQELYVFSDVAITLCAQKTSGDSNGSKSQIVSGCLNGIPHPEREAAEKRAAILEFEGCLKLSAKHSANGQRRERAQRASPAKQVRGNKEAQETTNALTFKIEYEIGIYQYGKLFNTRSRKPLGCKHGDD
jgi:hypothetical protein